MRTVGLILHSTVRISRYPTHLTRQAAALKSTAARHNA